MQNCSHSVTAGLAISFPRREPMSDHSELIDQAETDRREGKFSDAADNYAAGGFVRIGSSFPAEPYHGPGTSAGLTNLLRSAVCHRLATQPDRAQRRCEQGVLIATEITDRTASIDPPENGYDRARRGAWFEYVGDFRLLSASGEHETAYDEAIDIYQAADDPLTGYAEWEHMNLMGLFNDVSAGGGHDRIDWVTFDPERTLTEWVSYKTERFETYLDDLLKQDDWPMDED